MKKTTKRKTKTIRIVTFRLSNSESDMYLYDRLYSITGTRTSVIKKILYKYFKYLDKKNSVCSRGAEEVKNEKPKDSFDIDSFIC